MRLILTCNEINEIKAYKTDKTLNGEMGRHQKSNFIRKASRFSLEDDFLYLELDGKKRKVMGDDDLVAHKMIFNECHLPNHIGMIAMYYAVSERYVGFKRGRIDCLVSSCEACQRFQPLKRNDPIKSIVANKPWERIQADCIDLRKYVGDNDGYGWILNIIDVYSKFMYAFPMKNKTGKSVIDNLRDLFYKEGPPEILQTDNGKEFVNAEMTSLCQLFIVKHIRGRPRHPENQGQVERANQTLVRSLGKALMGNNIKAWTTILNNVVYKYNTTRHRAIGRSPMQVFRSRPEYNNEIVSVIEDEQEILEIPSEVVEFHQNYSDSSDSEVVIDSISLQPDFIEIKENIKNERELVDKYHDRYLIKMKEDADVHYHRTIFFPGDKVLIKSDFDNNSLTRKNKLEDFYEDGTWTVVRRVSSDAYKVSLNGHIKVISKTRLKKPNE